MDRVAGGHLLVWWGGGETKTISPLGSREDIPTHPPPQLKVLLCNLLTEGVLICGLQSVTEQSGDCFECY